MPGGDRTGPVGYGPMTGRAAGYCAGYGVPGYMNPIPGFSMRRGIGRGFGMGFGRGRGFGRMTMYNPRGLLRQRFWRAPFVQGMPMPGYANPYQAPTKEQIEILKEQRDFLNKEAKGLEKRIADLSK